MSDIIYMIVSDRIVGILVYLLKIGYIFFISSAYIFFIFACQLLSHNPGKGMILIGAHAPDNTAINFPYLVFAQAN